MGTLCVRAEEEFLFVFHNRVDIACAMQDAQDFNPGRTGVVKEPQLIKPL